MVTVTRDKGHRRNVQTKQDELSAVSPTPFPQPDRTSRLADRSLHRGYVQNTALAPRLAQRTVPSWVPLNLFLWLGQYQVTLIAHQP